MIKGYVCVINTGNYFIIPRNKNPKPRVTILVPKKKRKCCPCENTYDISYSVYRISKWWLHSLWKGPRKLVVEHSRFEMCVQLGVFMKKGSKCCSTHIHVAQRTSDALNNDVLEIIRQLFYVCVDGINHLINSRTTYAKKNHSSVFYQRGST